MVAVWGLNGESEMKRILRKKYHRRLMLAIHWRPWRRRPKVAVDPSATYNRELLHRALPNLIGSSYGITPAMVRSMQQEPKYMTFRRYESLRGPYTDHYRWGVAATDCVCVQDGAVNPWCQFCEGKGVLV